MNKYSKIVRFWGLCDIIYILWYIAYNLFNSKIPFYTDLIQATKTAISFESNLPIYTATISIILHFTMVFSGLYLFKEKKLGIILSYIQTPFRFLTFIPPSIFFISWPLKYIFENPKSISALITFILLILLSEAFKIVSVILWHKNFKPITSA